MANVSVIMGIYNCADTLPEAIDSLLAQTFTDWNLVMCDDGSRDATYEVAERYRRTYPERITLLKNEQNMGLNYTLNRCLSIADGVYIARQDGDDVSMPTRFEKEAAIRCVQLRKHSKAREKRYSFGYAVSFIFACYQILWTFPKSRYLCSRYLPLACG